MNRKKNKVSRYKFCSVLLLIIACTFLIKCLNIDADKIFLILFIFMTTLTLLFHVNSFIIDEIDKVKINPNTNDEQVSKDAIITTTITTTADNNTEINQSSNTREEINHTSNDKNAETIGFIERVLYFIGITTQNWTLISIVIIFKTIARYKEIDKQIKAEYFLIGSLLSLLSAIIISVVFISFDKIHNLGITNYILSLVSYNLNITNL